MLNLNFNTIGAIQKQISRPAITYVVRNDEFRDSIVLAVPGCVFPAANQINTEFGMVDPWDDISAYVRAGQSVDPTGSNTNLDVNVSSSAGPSIIYQTGSLNSKFPQIESNYPGALVLGGQNSLVVDKLWAAKQGANLTFSSSFVIELYAAFNDTGSFIGGVQKPDRNFAWKYTPTNNSLSSYLWEGTYGGIAPNPDPITTVSGSTRLIYTQLVVSSGGLTERYLIPTSSFTIEASQFNHYALVYSSGSTDYRRLKLYRNGTLIAFEQIDEAVDIQQTTNKLLQIFGTVQTSTTISSSLAWFNDYRIYNGTDKNYTGSQFTPPPSMVIYNAIYNPIT